MEYQPFVHPAQVDDQYLRRVLDDGCVSDDPLTLKAQLFGLMSCLQEALEGGFSFCDDETMGWMCVCMVRLQRCHAENLTRTEQQAA